MPVNESTGYIDLDEADFSLAEEVAARDGGHHLRNCYACGACSAFCPILPLAEGYDPRRLIRLVLLGQRELVLQEPLIWHCSTCTSCQEVCPQGVDFTEISFVLKNMALEAGYSPSGLTAQVDLLSGQGLLYAMGEFENEKRQGLGLPEVTERPDQIKTLLSDLAGRLARAKAADREGGEG